MAEDETTEPISVRVPRELLERVRRLAGAGDRSLTKQVVRLLRIGAAVEERGEAQ